MAYAKYYIYKEKVSYDSGHTWSYTGVEVTSGDPIAVYDTLSECEGITPYSGQYLTFVALDRGRFRFDPNGTGTPTKMHYSVDDGLTWTEVSSGESTVTVDAGSKVLWKRKITHSTGIGTGKFVSTGKFIAEGNLKSIRYGDDFVSTTGVTQLNYFYKSMFQNCTGLTSAENLIFPDQTPTIEMYEYMFRGCTNLTTAPSILPALSLSGYSAVPAKELADCYAYMFNGCTKLTKLPILPATTLSKECYNGMFAGCTSLTSVPSDFLPATTLANSCYKNMFSGCTSLTTVYKLSATTLANNCYNYMFKGCTSLTSVPSDMLPATTLSDNCYNGMFADCTSLTASPILRSNTLNKGCYEAMFAYCSNLKTITCLATDISASWCTDYWVYETSSTGTFYKNSSMNNWSTGDSGIPNGWTVQNYTS